MVKDETGNRYGKLIVIKRVSNDKHGNARWLCNCHCGRSYITLGSGLRSGKSSHCGCASNIDISGNIYGRLLVLHRMSKRYNKLNGYNNRVVNFYVCRCDCGSIIKVTKNHLTTGHTKSCGCYAKDRTKEVRTSHGLSTHPLYVVWKDMLLRCYDPRHKSYELYSSNNRTVCEEWIEDIKIFYEWSISNGWAKGLQLDRIDNSKGYSPSNCRFVTPQENVNNRSSGGNSKTGYEGVWFDKNRNNFQCYISSKSINGGVRVCLGRFDTIEEAVLCRNQFILDNNIPNRIQRIKDNQKIQRVL